jgi:hypothetical protein
MEQSPPSEADSSSARQEVPRSLRNPKVHHRVHRARHLSLSFDTKTSEMDSGPTHGQW